MKMLLLLACLLPAMALSAQTEVLLNEPLADLDLARYCGTWYEVAAIPTRFQKDCVATVVEYTLRPDGDINVHNLCNRDRLDGRLSSIKGKAWAPDKGQKGRLLVRFFWPFKSDYWVIEVGKDYEYAVVGSPQKDKYCWILSRERSLKPAVYEGILERLKRRGYDVGKIKLTLQPS